MNRKKVISLIACLTLALTNVVPTIAEGSTVKNGMDGEDVTLKSYSFSSDTLSAQNTNPLSHIHASSGGEISYNVSANQYRYGRWAKPVYSNLIENGDGSFTRIESCYHTYYNTNASDIVTIENYSGSFELLSKFSVPMELPKFGGYFKGENYHFLVFGQDNLEESNSVEVMRIVKYDKQWNRLDAQSIYGANTQYPFDGGSLRMTETGGNLYIHTSHQMYKSDDGRNHQANMSFVMNQSTMEITQRWYGVMNINYGYVSHSFNQFVKTDGEYLYRLDHGDAYPRAAVITKCRLSSITSCSNTNVINIMGTIGDNDTGLSVGGFELTDNRLIVVGNSVEQNAENWDEYGKRNIFVTTTNTDLSETKINWLTSYATDSTITARVPQLVKVSDNELYVLWEECDSADGSIFVRVVRIDSEGNKLSDVYKIQGRLSDCQPIYTTAGKMVWYVTEGTSPTFYELDGNELSNLNIANKIDINHCSVELEENNYTYQPYTYHKPKVNIYYGDYQLKEGTDYSTSYQNNYYPGTALVKISAKGIFEGFAEKEFQIVPIDISGFQLKLSDESAEYDGTLHVPEYTIYNGDVAVYPAGTFTYDSLINVGNGTCTFEADETCGYKGTLTANFTIVPKSISNAIVTLSDAAYDQNWAEIKPAVYQYDGSEKRPTVSVRINSRMLVEGRDYRVTYKNNVNIGTATLEVTGIGNYTGTVQRNFQITAAPEATGTPQPVGTPNPTENVTTTPDTSTGTTPEPMLKPDGSIVQENISSDGTYSTTTINPDGSSVEVTVNPEGTISNNATTILSVDQNKIKTKEVTTTTDTKGKTVTTTAVVTTTINTNGSKTITSEITSDDCDAKAIKTEKVDVTGAITDSKATITITKATTTIKGKTGNARISVSESLLSAVTDGNETKVNIIIGKNTIKKAISNKKVTTANVTLNIPNNKQAVIESVKLDKSAVKAMATSGKNLKVTVKKGSANPYSVTISKKNAKKLSGALELNLSISKASQATGKLKTNLQKALKKSRLNNKQASIVEFSTNKKRKATMNVTFSTKGISGVKAGSKVYVYSYNEKKGTFTLVSKNAYKVAKGNTITIITDKGGTYVVTGKRLK